jgi:integrase
MPSDTALREPAPRVPTYRRHRPSGQAVVTLNGRDIYLGIWNTKASRAEYDRLIGEWLAGGRTLPREGSDLSVAEVILSYLQFAKGYYVKNGAPTATLANIRRVLRTLRITYGHTSATSFGPLALEALQARFVQEGLSRSTVNDFVAIIKRMFRWATAKEMIPPAIHQALSALGGLRKGRTTAREPAPILPVADEVVDATLPHLPLVVADMMRVQRLVGCRPGEVCTMRPCDIDRTGEVWEYRPASHKTEHHGRRRVIFIGPAAQQILLPYLLRDPEGYCFAPADSERKRKAIMRANRKTPVQPSQQDRRKRRPKHRPGDHYVKDAYNRAICRAVEKANEKIAEEAGKIGVAPRLLPRWSPNQLRHSAATEIRRQFGLEAAQVILGHSRADVTQVYAERDFERAKEVMRKIG